MDRKLRKLPPSRPATLLSRLIEAPDLVRQVRDLPPPTFSALVRHVGVEDAGEIVALATPEQLVAAFDEDLFVNARPGQRETFDAARFAVWLEVLLEAGEQTAANRLAELSEDFLAQGLSTLVLVLDLDALRLSMEEDGRASRMADKALESALCEEIDGYLLVSRRGEGWDAALALILALDREHRALLERVLDRLRDASSELVEDLDALTSTLTREASLAEDVEAEREERRGREGHVEPRAARAFLTLARTPGAAPEPGTRDAVTRAYLRLLARADEPASPAAAAPSRRLLSLVGEVSAEAGLVERERPAAVLDETVGLLAALRLLGAADPAGLRDREEELAYLANVLVAGAEIDGRRFHPSEAAEAALATVALGAEREALARRPPSRRAPGRATAAELLGVLRATGADLLFRRASAELAAAAPCARHPGFLRSFEALEAHLVRDGAGDRRSPHRR